MPFDVGRFTEEAKPAQEHPAELAFMVVTLFAVFILGTYSLLELNVLRLFFNLNVGPIALLFAPLCLALMGLAVVYIFLYAVQLTGLEGFIQLMGLVSLLAIIPLIFLLPSFGVVVVPLVIMGLVVLLSAWHGTDSVRIRAERFLTMTSRIMLKEKELAVPTFAFLLIAAYMFPSYLGVMVLFGWVKFMGSAAFGYSIASINPVPIGVSLMFFIFAHLVFNSIFMGAVAGITYIWHRGEEPELMHGINLAAHRLDVLLPHAFHSSVSLLMSRVAGERMHDHFALQAVAITGRPTDEAVGISSRVLNNLPSILQDEIFHANGSEFVRRIFRDIILFTGIVIFIVSGSFPIALAFYYVAGTVFVVTVATMGAIYDTLLFSWALEREFGVADFGRMPPEMEAVLDRIRRVGGRMEEAKPHMDRLESRR